MNFVAADFVAPEPLSTPEFRLEPLGPEHNEGDYAAWTSSIDFIRGLPGWEHSSWPTPMSLEENRGDLEAHARGFAAREQFCYSVLDPADDDVIGCVYLKPTRPPRDGAVDVRSWVRADRAEADKPLHDAVRRWLRDAWPFTDVEYAAR